MPDINIITFRDWLCSRAVRRFLTSPWLGALAAVNAPVALPIPGDRGSEPSAELSKSNVRAKRTMGFMRYDCRLCPDLRDFSSFRNRHNPTWPSPAASRSPTRVPALAILATAL